MFAVLGVILSLSMVAYEMKLSREVAMAALFQESNGQVQETRRALLIPELYLVAIKKKGAGEKLTFEERSMHLNSFAIFMLNIDSKYYQYELGLIPEDEWRSALKSVRDAMGDPYFDEFWDEGSVFRRRFVREIEALRAEAAAES